MRPNEIKEPFITDCLVARNSGVKLLNEKWLDTKVEATAGIMLRNTNREQIINLGRCVDKVKYKWFNKTGVA